ncbi:tyrosine-type recombinase/integrase [Cupriavidus oxalaticus]|uniref:Site-specific integrase n=1 Tax=Cupriavidus oxalaticus TaxID=96344 RepID=A0A5P3VE92_9BURK|nr:tyrosine-type recombinase/integrase [Cupriavidus oxalaticus]QEZ44714.1 site-specific integrase [Cupriavidus oxalaticus]
MTRIDTTRARAALTFRQAPHWQRVAAGLFVGLRLMPDGAAPTWNIRYRHPDTGKQVYRALGDLLAFEEPDRFDHAAKAAHKFALDINGGAKAKPGTVADACRKYVEHQRRAKGEAAAHDAERRFQRLVYGTTIGDMLLSDLLPKEFAKWRDALIDLDAVAGDDEALRRARESANRNATPLRRALNLAYEHGEIGSNRGWKTVKQFKDTTGRRQVFYTPAQRAAILKAADDEPEVRAFIEAALLTCFRPGALAKLCVKDFDARAGVVRVPKNKTTSANVVLPSAAVALFKRMAKGKLPAAPLLHRPDGLPWEDANYWNPRIKAVGARAGLPLLCAYDLRHTAISALIEAGTDILTVARLARTSVQMIDKHYGHLHTKAAREKLDRAKVI